MRYSAVAGYGAAILAFLYALVSLYWAVGGTFLLDTVGGSVEEIARQGGGKAVALGLLAAVLKCVGGLVALALVRRWGRVWPLVLSAAESVVLILYGGLLVAAGALALSGVLGTPGEMDRTALRWHTAVWDMWFLIWGVLLAVATVSVWRERRAVAGSGIGWANRH